MKNMRWLWMIVGAGLGSCLCLAVCVGVAFVSPYLSQLQFEQAVKPGMPAPDFTLPGLVGGQISLSDYAGQPVLLTIATTW